MNCSECGEHLIAGGRFCTACGRRVGSTIVCPECQTPAPEGAKFCFNCGTELTRPMDTAPRLEPAVDPANVRRTEHDGGAPGRTERRIASIPEAPAEADTKPRTMPRPMRNAWPLAIVLLGGVLGMAAYWSAQRDDNEAKTDASRRMALATGALPTTAQDVAPGSGAFSTRRALQGLYGSYDPHLDGAFWTVSGAPREWTAGWNGREVLIKPLISKTDSTGTRHVLVTNTVDVKNGLVVKQGAGCRECASLLGAALFERKGDEWTLVTERRFMRIDGAWGAPPPVSVDFPAKGGVEVKIESVSERGRNPKATQAVMLHAGSPGTVPTPTGAATAARREVTRPIRRTTATAPAARQLVSAALEGDQLRVQALAAALEDRAPPHGDRALARRLNERGLSFTREHRYAEAAGVFRQAYAADPGDPEVRENLGYALLKAGKLAEAESALIAALETGPERPSAWGSLGYVYAKQGRRDEAVELMRTAHRVAPNPGRVLETYSRQARTESDPQVRAMLAEAVTRISTDR